MAELTPKNPLQVTQEEVKRVALACADEHGWSVRLDDCQVEEIPTPTQAIDEIGLGSRLYKPPANRWIVTFDAKAPPNRNKAVLGVPVELAWGKLWAHDLIVEEYPHQ